MLQKYSKKLFFRRLKFLALVVVSVVVALVAFDFFYARWVSSRIDTSLPISAHHVKYHEERSYGVIIYRVRFDVLPSQLDDFLEDLEPNLEFQEAYNPLSCEHSELDWWEPCSEPQFKGGEYNDGFRWTHVLVQTSGSTYRIYLSIQIG